MYQIHKDSIVRDYLFVSLSDMIYSSHWHGLMAGLEEVVFLTSMIL